MDKEGKKEPLTPEKLRGYKGLENLTGEEAEETVQNIKILVSILLRVISKEQGEADQNKKAA